MATTENRQTNAIANQINADNLYGLQSNSGCLQGTCPPNTINTGYYIPSLQEIASYNQSAPPIGVINPNSMQENQSSLQNQPIGPANQNTSQVAGEQLTAYQELPETPATVMNYGATMGSTVREDLGMSVTDYANPYPVTPESIQYLNGFIRTQIGRRATIDFLVGSNNLVSKTGYLLGVAQNYILINELDTNDITTCDFYNIKFIRFYY
jgi:hypothetical protein